MCISRFDGDWGGVIQLPDGSYRFKDGAVGRPGSLNEAQQREVDVMEAYARWAAGDESGVIALGIIGPEE